MSQHRATLRGVFTALATPMNADGGIDFGALEALVDWQIEQGVDGLVPCGTTGESATMTADERQRVIATVVKRAAGRATVIAGAGSNDTRVAMDHQRRAQQTGAAYALVATPYYNKPTPDGLVRHYEALLGAADMPIVLYNVPGRTACDMLPETVCRLAELDGVVAIKEATGDLDRVAAIRTAVDADFAILSGDDATALPFVLLGGDGVVSVTSNVMPREFAALIHAGLNGDVKTARELHYAQRPLFAALFLESNPIPVKAAMAMRGKLEENYRLPLCPMHVDNRQRLERVMRAAGLL